MPYAYQWDTAFDVSGSAFHFAWMINIFPGISFTGTQVTEGVQQVDLKHSYYALRLLDAFSCVV